MTKEEFLTKWEENLKVCERDYRNQYDYYHRGSHRGPCKRPDHIVFRNRLSGRLHHVYKEQLEQLPEEERIDIEKAATTMMLEKMRELKVEVTNCDDLGKYVKLDPKNIQYMDLLSSFDKESFFTKMATENPEVVSFLTTKQLNEISEGNSDYIVQLVKGNVELANIPPLSEIIAKDPSLTKEVTILKKQREVAKLSAELEVAKRELEELAPTVEKAGGVIGE